MAQRSWKGKSRLAIRDSMILSALDDRGHPMTRLQIASEIDPDFGTTTDTTARRELKRVGDRLRVLESKRLVWRPIGGFWARYGDDAADRFLDWVEVLGDTLSDEDEGLRSLAMTVLSKVVCLRPAWAIERGIVERALLTLMREVDVAKKSEVDKVDKSIRFGLVRNSRVRRDMVPELLKNVVDYTKRSASTGKVDSSLGIQEFRLVANRAGLDVSWGLTNLRLSTNSKPKGQDT